MQPEPIQDFIRKFLADNPFRTQPDDEVWATVRDRDGSESASRQALAVLLERCGGDVYAVCRSRLGRHQDADDVFQDAVLALLRRRPLRVNSLADARRWLCGVARNKAADRFNSRAAAGPLAPDHPAPTGTDPDPLGRLDAVLAAVAGLPDKYRLPFRLRHIDGLTAEQVAGRLGLKVRTVDQRLLRAKRRVLATLTRQGVPTTAAAALVQTTLPDAGRAATLSPERAAALADAILARAATLPAAGLGVVKVLVVGGALLAGGGLTWAAWPTPEPQVLPQQPPAVAAVSYQDELIRVFRGGIEDRLRAALHPMALGDGGRVEPLEVDAQGPRIFVTLRVVHGRPYQFNTRLRFVRDTWTGQTHAMYDFWGDGSLADYEPGKLAPPPALRLLLRPVWGHVEQRLTGAMAAAIAVVSEIPTDPRAVAEQARFFAVYKAAAAPLAGEWRTDGPNPQPVWWEWDESQPMPLSAVNVRKDGKGWVPFAVGWHAARIGRDGRPMDLGSYRRPCRVSADGNRIEFFNPDGTPAGAWTRPPGWKP